MNNTNEILLEYSKIVSSKLGKFTGVLYGSIARGDNNLWSILIFSLFRINFPRIH
jgi:hypothetical protein